MDSFDKLQHADDVLVKISGIIFNFDNVTPSNIDEEWDKFKESECNYSPQLKYNEFNPKQYIKELKEIDIPKDTPIGELFDDCRNKMLKYATMLLDVGTDHFNTTNYFGKITNDLLMNAHQIIDMKLPKIKPSNKTIPSKELAEIMQKEFDKYNIEGWTIKFRKNSSSPVSINAGAKTLIVNKGKTYSDYRIKKLLIHEIGTHVLRAVNGHNQEFRIFSVGLPGYEYTEEGLAGYNEREQGYKSKQTMIRYAIRVIATKVASMGGFMDVYNVIRPLVYDNERAFRTSIRIKRGLGDTSKPGGLLKDHVYLQGMLLIEKFVDEGGDIRDLYAGKIRVGDVHLVHNGTLKPAKILPDFLQ